MNSKVIDKIKIKGGRALALVEGDITERNVDVIVNPANSYLQHGGGVARTIKYHIKERRGHYTGGKR